jgi:hypothetical protein
MGTYGTSEFVEDGGGTASVAGGRVDNGRVAATPAQPAHNVQRSRMKHKTHICTYV